MTPQMRFVTLRRPRRAVLDTTDPRPAVYLSGLLDAELNYSMPARRRGRMLLVPLARRGLPTRALASALRALPARPRPELDALLEQVRAAWPTLSSGLGTTTGIPHSVLCVDRSAARTTFVFGGADHPVLVLKEAKSGNGAVAREAEVLRQLSTAGVGPRQLGHLDHVVVQEGLRGLPARVLPVRGSDARDLTAPTGFPDLVGALQRVAVATASQRSTADSLTAALTAAESYPLDGRSRRAVRAVRQDLTRLPVAVLQHKDLSPQNWLVCDGRLTGMVDWEEADRDGTPAFDVLHAAVAVLEHGVGLVRWSDARVLAAFTAAWPAAPLFVEARRGAAAAAQAAEVPDELVDPLLIAWFARRLGRALIRPTGTTLPPDLLAAMLAVVCRD